MVYESNLLTRKRVDFGALAEVLARGVGYYSFRPALDDQEVFEVYRWIMTSVTGKGFDRWSWSTRRVRESLAANFGGRPNCGSSGGMGEPILETIDQRHQDYRAGGWREEMARRLACVLFDKGPAIEWRKAMGISLTKPRPISMLVYDHVPPPPRSTAYDFDGKPYGWTSHTPRGKRSGFDGEVDRLFALASTTRRLRVAFRGDEEREDADEGPEPSYYLTAVMLEPYPEGWVASIEYGFDGSRWNDDYRWLYSKGKQREPRGERDPLRCFQRKDEPFANFVYRAHDKFDALLTPACVPRPAPIGREPPDGWRCPSRNRDGFHGAAPPGLSGWSLNQTYGGNRCEEGP
jgi:hypothetical protein